MAKVEKLVIITKHTWLEGLIEQFNTKAQANFYIDQNLGPNNFTYYEESHNQYYKSLNQLKKSIPDKLKYQIVESSFLPNFLFNKTDLVVCIGPDGLVVNTAKYLNGQYILAINPDIQRIDGVLLPFTVESLNIGELIENIEQNDINLANITMAKAELNDNQVLYGVNDLFIGQQTHVSARYTLEYGDMSESQSSSGIIVSTGAGSTGWFRSIITGAIGITQNARQNINIGHIQEDDYRFHWDADYIYFSVREPFKSKTSGTDLIFGTIYEGDHLKVTSKMPDNGVIFSDGVEKDYLRFNSGTIAKIGIADKKVRLLLNS
ncbi:MAG: sugar kinase [Candidatus Lokiarchaeota archaeon]|nr:sugar kinase [Candidatus Lokiarchaeota archaeon]MBD3339095.1 sugar kinase [Candidatus Lokiarchaeota archaeon]